LPEVSAICERVVIINKGIIAAEDTPGRLADDINQFLKLTMIIMGEQEKIVKTINTIDGVKYIEASAKTGENAYKYVIEADLDVREKVFYKLAKAGCPILESKPSTMTMEDIFINVVTQGAEEN